MSISDNIKKIREEYKLTQEEFGKIAGVTDKAVSTWELGIKAPRMGAVQKISEYFNIPKSAILDDSPKEDVDFNKSLAISCDFMTLDKRIKELRLKANLTQEELAERIGVKKQTIYKYETGIVTNIPSDRIEQISKVFGVTPDYIMGWKNIDLSACTLCPLEQELLDNFRKLTDHGKKTAIERIKEMTELSIYTLKSGKK